MNFETALSNIRKTKEKCAKSGDEIKGFLCSRQDLIGIMATIPDRTMVLDGGVENNVKILGCPIFVTDIKYGIGNGKLIPLFVE